MMMHAGLFSGAAGQAPRFGAPRPDRGKRRDVIGHRRNSIEVRID